MENSDPTSRRWRQSTRSQSRRVRFWVKNSLLAHTNKVEFQQEEEEEESVDFEQQQEHDNSSQEHVLNDHLVVCHDIDEAMAALHTLRGDAPIGWKDAPLCKEEYDWILDGDPEWAAEYDKSQRLQQSLQELELEDPMAKKLDFDVLLGRQENRFANFDDDFIVNKPVQEEEEEFGDFVSADAAVGDSNAENNGADDSSRMVESKVDAEKDSAQGVVQDCDNNDPKTPAAIKTSTAALVNDSNDDIIPTTQESPHSVYKLFSLADVSSPESRFTRRRQLMTNEYAAAKVTNQDAKEWWCKSQEEMQEELPCEYYTESFDGTLQLLLDLPWQHVPCWQQDDDKVDVFVVDEHVTQKLSQLDAARANVKKRLIRQIQQRENMLQEGNQLLHDMDHNLAMAHMYVHRGKDALNRAQGREEDLTGIMGIGTLMDDWDRRDQLRQVKSVLDRCNKLLETEESLEQRIASFGTGPMMQDADAACQEYQQVIEIATQLRKDVDHDECLSRLACLDPLRERACTVVETFRKRIDAALNLFLGSCCHTSNTFSSCEYETLLRAMLEIHAHQTKEYDASGAGAGCKDAAPPNPAISWSQCVLKSLCYEADKCLARALLDPTLDEDGESAESLYDKELIHLGFELNNGSGDNAKLRTLMHNLVTIRFDFEVERNHLPWVYHKLCMLLADVLHTHYILLQWHRAPFDPRNKDTKYLHRRKDNKIPEEKKTDEFHTSAESVATSSISNGINQARSDCCCDNASNPQHYGIESSEQLDRIAHELQQKRVPLWRHCESVLVTCLDQYLHFSAKKKLFQGTEDDSSDGEKAWLEDLERLHDVLRLTLQFMMLGREFLGPDSTAEVTSLKHGGQKSVLREKLRDVFRKHLRIVHVEAMNTTGTMLLRESWKLVPVESGRSVTENGKGFDKSDSRASGMSASEEQRAARKCVLDLLEEYKPVVNSKQRCWENRMVEHLEQLPNYPIRGNPFIVIPISGTERESGSVEKSSKEQTPDLGESDDPSGVETERMELYCMICSFLAKDDRSFPSLGTETAVKGLAKWTWRLITIMKRIPIILEDTALVFSNIFDLYFTTVFRLCSGSAVHEKILLGLEVQSRQELAPVENGFSSPDPNSSAHRRHSSGSGIFSRQRRSSKTPPPRPVPVASSTAAADICAPLPHETKKIASLREFIERGQASLDGIVQLDKIDQWMTEPATTATKSLDKDVVSKITTLLERREGAAWSCLFVAALLDAAWSHTNNIFVRSCYLDTLFGENERFSSIQKKEDLSKPLGPLAAYVKSVVKVMPALAELASRVSCAHAMMTKSIVQDVISVRQWGESNVHVESNDYIHDLTNRYSTTWLFLKSSPHPLPTPLLDKTWDHLQSAAYLSILDGFARVCRYLPSFPAEGIALMSMDVFAFESGLAEIESRSGGTARQLVSQWITALYFPMTDLMQWIVSNHANYQLNHSLALVTCRAGSEGKSNNATDMVTRVRKLYCTDGVKSPLSRIQRHYSC